MKDLLKEAIADAKAVRQTALANAKIALEEAFTPRLQSMLSAKLAEEMSDDDDEMSDDMDTEETMDTDAGNEMEDDMSDDMDTEETMTDDTMEEGEDDMSDDIMDEGEDDLDLDEIIRELEMSGDESEMSEYDDMEEDMYAEEDDTMEEGEDMADDEEVDIQEIIRSLREEDEEDAPAEEEAPAEELEEAYNVIKFLKGKINEVNLLNAKLLYSNKLFRNFTLNENQKMKVIENFDRAHSLREVKLVYSTLAEGFKMPATKKIVRESFASKPSASTKPANKQVISEGAELAARFKKLAGLK
jgi:hypothetical protein